MNVPDFRFHDLRHTAASWMRMKDADIHTVALILGHKEFANGGAVSASQPCLPFGAVKLLDGAYAEPSEVAPKEASGEPKIDQVRTLSLP